MNPAPMPVRVPVVSATIHGRVTWQGELPLVPPLEVRGNPLAPTTFARRGQRPNPNEPRIHPTQRGVADAVVFLRNAPSLAGLPWPHPPVRVEVRDKQIQIFQGREITKMGFVVLGRDAEFVSRDDCYHSLHLRGAAFTSFTLPDRDQPLRHTLDRVGIVELSSGAGHYWMRGYLVVSDHPVVTRTDADGQFQLEKVPAGEYELVCWLPNWQVARQERDPESGVVTRLAFRPPLERTRRVDVRAAGTSQADFVLSLSPDNIDAR